MENFVFALLAAAISGLTFLAYKHPTAYKKIFNFLWFTSFAILIGVFIWNSAGTYIWVKIVGEITSDQREIIEPLFDSSQVSYFWTMIIYVVVQAYLLFLDNLPKLLSDD